jgi:hypothetical protein
MSSTMPRSSLPRRPAMHTQAHGGMNRGRTHRHKAAYRNGRWH